MRCTKIFLLFCFLAASRSMAAAELPPAPQPQPPFPQIMSDAFSSEFIAPGISEAEYAIQTKEGPLEIFVVDANLRDPSVRVDTVLANDELVSAGEKPTSMAARTGAVAGINADYFDIGNTNIPLGVVVRNGHLERTPSPQAAFALTRDRRVLMSPLTFAGTALVGTIPIALSGINKWPVYAGVSLITPLRGSLPASPGLTLARLTPLDADGTAFARYRIDEVITADQPVARGYWLAISGEAAQTLGTPALGDVVSLSETSTTDFANIAAAVGGGPLLIDRGERYVDPKAPAGKFGRTRIPVSAAALREDGTLMLVEVDGREPFHSVGLTRDELTSFLLSIGAVEAVSFDGGGSSALVARKLGERNATLRNQPSDGTERAVADGLFIYSDAPFGEASRLTVYPQHIRAFAGSSVALSFATTDAAGHPAAPPAAPVRTRVVPQDAGHVLDGTRFEAGPKAASGTLHVARGSLTADVPVEIVRDAARAVIVPRRANMRPGETRRFALQAYDRAGFEIALPDKLHWSASSGMITDGGVFTATADDARLQVKLGDKQIVEDVSVGEHEEALQMTTQWRFTTVPADGPGDLTFGVPCPFCIQLSYDFTGAERDATMIGDRPLPLSSLGLRMDVNGDGNGEILRVSIVNAINERVYLTVGRVNWRGWQSKEVRFPPSLAVPAQLHTIYVLNALGGEQVHVAGSIAIRNVRVILAGKS